MKLFHRDGTTDLAPESISDGIRLDGDSEMEAVSSAVSRAQGSLVIVFSAMKDGRGYSLARLLRGRLGYRGQLVASGPLIADQADFLFRCGFDAVELPDEADTRDWTKAARRFSVHAQPAIGDP